jgi:hypothetical protein
MSQDKRFIKPTKCAVLFPLKFDKGGEMLRIKQSKTADTRSAETRVDKETLLASSHQHIGDVQLALHWMACKLGEIALRHDWTKIDGIAQFAEDFKAVQNDKGLDFKQLPWFKRHVTSERHHVNDCCPEDVNFFDLLERIADITMAGMARTGKIYDDTLSPEILTKAYKNTVELLKSQIEVREDK